MASSRLVSFPRYPEAFRFGVFGRQRCSSSGSNGNPYSGAEGRYALCHHPIKVPDPSDEGGRKARGPLCRVWPGPWSIEHTAEEKIETQLFDGDQAGLDKAVAWLHERYSLPRQTAGQTSRRSSTVSRTADVLMNTCCTLRRGVHQSSA